MVETIVDFVTTIRLEHIPGRWQIIEKYTVPKPLKKGEYYHDSKNSLNYHRDSNGLYSVSTTPNVYLHYKHNGNTKKICIALFLKDYFGLTRIRTDRIKKLEQIMPSQISIIRTADGKNKLSKIEIENWFAQYK